MFPKYSFVLPAYKATFLREAIDSILNQTYKDFELIIVNDASPEDLSSIVNSYHDERIRYYVNEKNIGGTDLVAQWNYCITYAMGDYLILASDDDVYYPDYLEKMDVLVDKYPDVNVFRPRVVELDENNCIKGVSEQLEEYLSHIDFLLARCKGYVSSGVPFYIFKREEIMTMGGFVNFPTAWISDDATVIHLAKKGIVSHDEILFSFRMSGLNISSKLNNKKMLADKLKATELFYKWYEHELNELNIVEMDDLEKRSLIFCSISRNSMLNGMAQNITASDKEALLSCWSILRRTTSLSSYERMIICRRAYIWLLLNKLKSFLKSLREIYNNRNSRKIYKK